MRVTVTDAKNRLLQLIKAVENGEAVTIYLGGVPVVDLVRTKTATGEKPKFGTLKGRIVINDPDWWKPVS